MKKFVITTFAALFLLVTASGILDFQKANPMSDLALANVEALAEYESPDIEIGCSSKPGTCWYSSGDCMMGWFLRQPDCAFCGYTAYSCSTLCDH